MLTLTTIFPKARSEIFRLLFDDPSQERYLRDLSKSAGLSPAALLKEMSALVASELILSRRDGNRHYFRANVQHPLYPEIHGLVAKTYGLVANLRRALTAVDGIEAAFVFGSAAAGTMTSSSDIDVLVLGPVGLRKIAPALRKLALTFNREVNPHCITVEEWKKKRALGDAFTLRVSTEPKIWLVGSPDDIATVGS